MHEARYHVHKRVRMRRLYSAAAGCAQSIVVEPQTLPTGRVQLVDLRFTHVSSWDYPCMRMYMYHLKLARRFQLCRRASRRKILQPCSQVYNDICARQLTQ